jgi:hypothetical protein
LIPARDADVPALIWEIRRERRMEFVFEDLAIAGSEKMEKDSATWTLALTRIISSGPWVNVQAEIPTYLTAANVGKVRVKTNRTVRL